MDNLESAFNNASTIIQEGSNLSRSVNVLEGGPEFIQANTTIRNLMVELRTQTDISQNTQDAVNLF
jgi:hypothetical protein